MKSYMKIYILALFLVITSVFPLMAREYDYGYDEESAALAALKDAIDDLQIVASLTELETVLENILDKASAVIEEYPDQSGNLQFTTRTRLQEYLESFLASVDLLLDELIDTETQPSDVSGIVETTGGIVSAMADLDVFPTRGMILTGASISKKVARGILDDILLPRNVTQTQLQEYLDNPDEARSYFSVHEGALGTTAEATLVPFASRFEPSAGFSDVLPRIVDMENPVWTNTNTRYRVDATSDSATGLDLFKNVWPNLDESSTVTVDSASGNIKVLREDKTGAAVSVSDMGPVSEYLTYGLNFLPDGRRFGVDSDVGFMMAPATPDPQAVVDLVQELGGTIFFEDNGVWRLNLVPGVDIVCSWDWDLQPDNRFAAGTASFTVTGTDFATEAFAVLVSYEDGTVQQAAPVPRALAPLLTMLDTRFPGLFILDRTTGVLDLTLAGLGKFKADWRFESLENEYDSLVSQVLAGPGSISIDSLVFEAGDFNQDGKVDLQYYSPDPKGRQILYGL